MNLAKALSLGKVTQFFLISLCLTTKEMEKFPTRTTASIVPECNANTNKKTLSKRTVSFYI